MSMENMPICARCKKNMAVVFITKLENGKSVNEGLCLKCAKELGIKPVTDLLNKFGLKDEDLDGLTPEALGESLPAIMEEMGLSQDNLPAQNENEDDETPSRAPAFPLFNLFRQRQENTEQKPADAGNGRRRILRGAEQDRLRRIDLHHLYTSGSSRSTFSI